MCTVGQMMEVNISYENLSVLFRKHDAGSTDPSLQISLLDFNRTDLSLPSFIGAAALLWV